MCIVCVLWDKDKLTIEEAKKALWEQVMQAPTDEEIRHYQSVYADLEEESKK